MSSSTIQGRGRGENPSQSSEAAVLPPTMVAQRPLSEAGAQDRTVPAPGAPRSRHRGVHRTDAGPSRWSVRRTTGAKPALGEPESRPGIAGTAYDTAWLGCVPGGRERRSPRFPGSLQWVVEHQHEDGSWGSSVRYEHDRILSTLAALTSLATFGRRVEDRACLARGTRYLWQHGHLHASEPVELVGFELLLPALVQRAERAGVHVPPHLHIYERERTEKLRLIPPAALYSARTTAVHSLEFLGDDADTSRLAAAQGANGAIGNSPAATAFYLMHQSDERAIAYLRDALARTGGAMAPVLYPCETFELLWAAYHLSLAGVPAARLVSPSERVALWHAVQAGGVSLSPSFPIADADDTAVALLLLHELGEPVDTGTLRAFVTPEGHFASFPYERHTSVGVNIHVLHALLRVPGYPEREQTIERVLDYLACEQRNGLYWIDKWHISPYYATAHALAVLAEVPPAQAKRMQPLVERARAWLRETQNADGSWGFYGQPTAEETAYAVLALLCGGAAGIEPRDRQRCAAASQYLEATTTARTAGDLDLPALWIDKCLYTPTLVVEAVITAAQTACRRARRLGVWSK